MGKGRKREGKCSGFSAAAKAPDLRRLEEETRMKRRESVGKRRKIWLGRRFRYQEEEKCRKRRKSVGNDEKCRE